MKSATPPPLATWLLMNLAQGTMEEALVGDLREEFVRGRSAGWYWRQVVLAIVVSSFRELLACRKYIVLAVLWAGATYAFSGSAFRWLFHSGGRSTRFIWVLPWPWSLACEMAVTVLVYAIGVSAGFSVCLLAGGRLRARAFLAGLRMAVPILIIGEIAMTFIIQPYALNNDRRAPYAVICFCALLTALGAARRQHLSHDRGAHQNG